MEKFQSLNDQELLLINGGSEKSYSIGYEIGRFLGAFTSNVINATVAFADGVREGVQAVKDLKI